ncbi:conserved hypothetical protein, partial [Trichinella spiralis]|uniref:hypothetical protein n=1 Tax=Trichinella spiralis TaxID=6334 RepID=UPI0001EFEC10
MNKLENVSEKSLTTEAQEPPRKQTNDHSISFPHQALPQTFDSLPLESGQADRVGGTVDHVTQIAGQNAVQTCKQRQRFRDSQIVQQGVELWTIANHRLCLNTSTEQVYWNWLESRTSHLVPAESQAGVVDERIAGVDRLLAAEHAERARLAGSTLHAQQRLAAARLRSTGLVVMVLTVRQTLLAGAAAVSRTFEQPAPDSEQKLTDGSRPVVTVPRAVGVDPQQQQHHGQCAVQEQEEQEPSNAGSFPSQLVTGESICCCWYAKTQTLATTKRIRRELAEWHQRLAGAENEIVEIVSAERLTKAKVWKQSHEDPSQRLVQVGHVQQKQNSDHNKSQEAWKDGHFDVSSGSRVEEKRRHVHERYRRPAVQDEQEQRVQATPAVDQHVDVESDEHQQHRKNSKQVNNKIADEVGDPEERRFDVAQLLQ